MTEPVLDRSTFPRLRPQSVLELSDAVRGAVAAGQGVFPEGGGTLAAVGYPPLKSGITLDLRGLGGVEDYPARDMTITVGAGLTIAELQAALAAEGQRLPIDVPNPERATVGGALAANQSGSRRYGWGTLRDYCIGVRFVTDTGEEVKGGGRVVKNVAGYDLMKMQIGAWGTLGVVTQATLKVTPKPEDQAFVAFGVNAAAIGPTLDRLHQTATRPAAVELLSADAASAPGVGLGACGAWVLAVGYEEKRTTIDWQLKTLREELRTAPIREWREVRGPAACGPLWDGLTALIDPAPARFALRASVRPSKFAEFVTAASALPELTRLHAHAGNGVAHLRFDGDDLDADRAVAILDALGVAAVEAGGRLSVRTAPPTWRDRLPRSLRDTPETRLMRRVKRTLDPNNAFNPGRLFGDV